jgi:hypothetical protein
MAILEVNNSQLRLIQKALDFYSRIGIGQFGAIKEHPSFEKNLYNVCRPDREPIIGDRTLQGEILDIKDGKALIAGSVKNKMWNEEHEWKKLEDVKLSTDYTKYHNIRDNVDTQLAEVRNTLIQDYSLGKNGSWLIHNEKVDETCREAYDIVQVIRHEFWKADETRSSITVDSSIHLTTKDTGNIKVILMCNN